MRILLVEDDELLGDGTCIGLRQLGHTVDWVKDGKTANDVLSKKYENFDVIVLDLGLPRLAGIDVLKKLRERNSPIPVIILTARDSIEERISGLDAGADDYITKPFDLGELSARIRALQRRAKSRANPIITHNNITLDPASHLVTLDGKPIEVSRREFILLRKFLENTDRIITRDQLSQTLYGWGDKADSNALEVHIHNLRKRFGSDFIKTVRGVGYIIKKSD
jgi:two-component system response regulator QseB